MWGKPPGLASGIYLDGVRKESESHSDSFIDTQILLTC